MRVLVGLVRKLTVNVWMVGKDPFLEELREIRELKGVRIQLLPQVAVNELNTAQRLLSDIKDLFFKAWSIIKHPMGHILNTDIPSQGMVILGNFSNNAYENS